MSGVDAATRDATTTPGAGREPDARHKVCVVGSGPHFLSGISYYTNKLVNELGRRHRVSAILMRTLLPTRLYPGRERVGAELTNFTYPEGSRVFDGIDWWWGRGIARALRLLSAERPDFLVLQWWSGTVLHTYLLLAAFARLRGARVVLEFHEVLDTAEDAIPAARRYVGTLLPLLLRMTDGFVVHTEFDRAALQETYGLGDRPVALIPHGPYDQYASAAGEPDETQAAEPEPEPDDRFDLLYFGVIRPFKGVEDLIEAFDELDAEEAAKYRLTVVGETWEGCTEPAAMIARSPHRASIEFVNRYVTDAEVAGFFDRADAVVLPYHRSSASGPLQLAMAHGLPVVVTAVGGLIEAVRGYEGAISVPPRDPQALRAAFAEARGLRGVRFADVHSWERTLDRYGDLFATIVAARSGVR
jgi:glycosyltransferase involved in cell wall biosynthesis